VAADLVVGLAHLVINKPELGSLVHQIPVVAGVVAIKKVEQQVVLV
jgi:hypothetical protein